MSRYRGNRERCPYCQVTYARFKTGLRYRDVFLMLWDNSRNTSEWRYKRRGTILGLWHSIKKELWSRHTDVECASMEQSYGATGTDDAVPF